MGKENNTKDLLKQIEELTKENKRLKLSNTIVIDGSDNLDDSKKKIFELIREGKVIKDNKGPFIIAEQNRPPYETGKVNHKIYCDEIVQIFIKRYYENYSIANKSNRTLINQAIWCYHKGYVYASTISEDQLNYLLDKGFILDKDIRYLDVDCLTGKSYSTDKNGLSIKAKEDYDLKKEKTSNKMKKEFSNDNNEKIENTKEKVIEEPKEDDIGESIQDVNSNESTNDDKVKSEDQENINENNSIDDNTDFNLDDINLDDFDL